MWIIRRELSCGLRQAGRGARSVALAALSLLAGCAQQGPASPLAAVAFPVAAPAEADFLRQQCAALASPQTRPLLAQLASENLEVQSAWARVRQAAAQERQAAAARLPSLQLLLQGSRSKTNLEQFGPIAPPGAFYREQYEVSLGADYEFDLWNRLGNTALAARRQSAATRGDALAMAVSLSAEVLENWFDLAFQLRQRALIEEQVDTGQVLLELLQQRFLLGSGTVLDALQQKQQQQALQTALAGNRADILLNQQQLAVLLGRRPDDNAVPLPASLPELPPINEAASFSASALAQRPDLRAAFFRLQAADATLAAALAERLPGVSLSAALFNQTSDASALGETLLWRIAAALTQPVYAGGRISARIDESQARLELALLQYRQSMLQALQELASARINERREQVRLANVTEQLRIAQNAYRLARQQFLQGAVDYLRVLNAFTSLNELQQEQLRSRRQRLSYRIQFCRALGIDWLGHADRLR